MFCVSDSTINVKSAVYAWWREQRQRSTFLTTSRMFTAIMVEFLKESTPEQKRQRFGDADYDWEYRVDTTSANVSWQSRFIGLLNSSYQPIERDLFHEMLNALGVDYS